MGNMKIEEGNQLEKYWNDYWVSVLKREDCSRNNKRETKILRVLKCSL